MVEIRPGDTRGHFDFGWLDTRHTFSFGDYHDPRHMGFRALRVINEDWIQAGQGFGTHGHRDMEILTWVLSGALEHRDSLGTRGLIRPGEAQVMSAGTGITHSEFNASDAEPLHLLQIWLLPERRGLAPRYDQVAFSDEALRNRFCRVAGPGSVGGSVRLFQDVEVFVARLDPGVTLQRDLQAGRAGYLQVARGEVDLGGARLGAGDGASLTGEAQIRLQAGSEAEVLLFDLA